MKPFASEFLDREAEITEEGNVVREEKNGASPARAMT
jgi:hypothetical protein